MYDALAWPQRGYRLARTSAQAAFCLWVLAIGSFRTYLSSREAVERWGGVRFVSAARIQNS